MKTPSHNKTKRKLPPPPKVVVPTSIITIQEVVMKRFPKKMSPNTQKAQAIMHYEQMMPELKRVLAQRKTKKRTGGKSTRKSRS
jgi:hypothetical protein